MTYEISEKPVIKKRTLDDEKLIFSVDLEKGRFDVEGILDTEYDNAENTVTRDRPRITLRGPECEAAMNVLLPDDDQIVWTNPRKIFKKLLVKLLEENIV